MRLLQYILAMVLAAPGFAADRGPALTESLGAGTDAQLIKAQSLPNLTWIHANSPQVTDTGLSYLRGLRKLESLSLWRASVSNAGLEHLAGLQTLKTLNIADTMVTDDGLKHLQELQNLDTLWLENTRISGAGLKHIEHLKIYELSLLGTDLKDDGLKHLGNMVHLEWLSIANTDISDEGLVQLKSLQALETLDLSGTKITDACLATLLHLKKLKHLNVRETRITPDGLKRFREALPKVSWRSRRTEREAHTLNAILGNLRLLEGAKESWAFENRKTNGTPVPDVAILSKYLKNGKVAPVAGETYHPNPTGTPASATLRRKLGIHEAGSKIVAW